MNISNLVFRETRKSVGVLFQRCLQTSSTKMVQLGDTIPSVDLYENSPTNIVNLAKLSSGKKIILFAVPGAFTPGCSKTHLPGYVKKADELKESKGINEIICVSVNDPFVMAAWAKDQNTAGKVRLLADPSAALAKALDLTVDIPPLGGTRSKRYSMVIDNGKITSLQVEPDGTEKGFSVTILDAYCKIGRYLALLLKQNPHISELRLYDKNSKICAVAEDLSHIDTRTKVKSFGGKPVLKHAVTDADVVIAVGGCKESHKETAKHMFEKNVDEMRIAALHMVEFNPKAVLCISKPPLEALIPVVTEEYKKAGVYDSRRIIGITNVTCMRANSLIAAESGKNAAEVMCPVVGGSSLNCVVAVLSQVRPKGLTLPATLQKTIDESENDVLKLYADCGTVCLTPALAIARFMNTLLKAFKGETSCAECAFVRQTGHIGQFLPYMTSIVKLGRNGIMSSHMPHVSGDEALLLKKASIIIKEYVRMGEYFVTGEVAPIKREIPAEKDNVVAAITDNIARESQKHVQKHV
ncbi:hypothetical protein JTB14_001620 [Gonioctena quinquepunctata]|nr:hypothetical protein JTB14_001620 [Gonioctena quinquepunctata]